MGYYLDHADFIKPGAAAIATWTWRPLPEPGFDSLPARGQEWEMTRYREYQARLSDRPWQIRQYPPTPSNGAPPYSCQSCF